MHSSQKEKKRRDHQAYTSKKEKSYVNMFALYSSYDKVLRHLNIEKAQSIYLGFKLKNQQLSAIDHRSLWASNVVFPSGQNHRSKTRSLTHNKIEVEEQSRWWHKHHHSWIHFLCFRHLWLVMTSPWTI